MRADFARLIGRLAEALAAAKLPFMLIGGQAVLVHGEPRLTQDIDVTLGVAPDRLADLLAICEAIALQPLPDDVEAFVKETFVLPVRDEASTIRVDLIFSTSAYERAAIQRAVEVDVAGTRVPFASAEDLILHKLIAGRPRDLEDAAGVVRRRGDALDWDYITRWAQEFAQVPGKEDVMDLVRRLNPS